MTEPYETSWCLQRGIGTARVIVDLVGDHVNELPDPVCLAFAAQMLESLAAKQGVDDVQYQLWFVETKHHDRGVVVAKDEDEARRRWIEKFPGYEIDNMDTGTDALAAFI